jgi:alpha-L-rhamnosidase
MAAPRISKLTFGRNANPIGIGQARPSLSWRYEQDHQTAQGWIQTAFEITLRRGDEITKYNEETRNNVEVPWPKDAPPLKSREVVQVSVRAKGDSEWTGLFTETLEAALLDRNDWTASVIAPDITPPANAPKRPFYTRRTVSINLGTGRSRIYATALGVYEIKVNGKRIGDHVLAPGWQSYNHRLHYQTYVIEKGVLVDGDNVIEAVVGEGWYSGRLTWAEQRRNIWGSEIGVQLQLEHDGQAVAFTDERWEWSYGQLLESALYDGEVFDASLSHTEWRATKVIAVPRSTSLIAPEAPPIRETEILKPKALLSTPSHKKIIDFGQNLVGWVKIMNVPASKSANDCLILRFAEVLDKGELGTRPLRSAKATDKVYLGEKPLTQWQPAFTTHGFRFCEVTGPPGILDDYMNNFEAVVVHSDMERIGDFSCSHDLINKLHQNVVWGLRGNFVGLPTDCPQRDERWALVIATCAILTSDLAGQEICKRSHRRHHSYTTPPVSWQTGYMTSRKNNSKIRTALFLL